MNQTYPNAGSPSGSWNPDSFANQNLNTNPQYPGSSGQTDFGYQPPPRANNPVPPGANAAASFSGAIAVRPSGSFQPPAQGVSYGQPIGFNQSPGAGQQNSALGQNNSQAQLEGLNVGPGALFPIGQGISEQNGTLRMANVSAPGSNSMINGAMYGQPVSTLPPQEWTLQQQQQIQQQYSQSPQSNQNGQGNRQGYSPPPYSGSNAANPQFGELNGDSRTAMVPRPGVQAPPANPLATYENQLRQLDNQYNNTLQQLDRNTTGAIPRAQY